MGFSSKLDTFFNATSNCAQLDPSIEHLNKYLLTSRIVSSGINDLADGKRNLKRLRATKFMIFTFNIILVRSSLYFIARFLNSDALLTLIGDYFAVLDLGGDILMFWYLAYSVLFLIYLPITYVAEANGHCDIITEFRNSHDGFVTLISEHLSQQNFRSFKIRSKFATLFVPGLYVAINTVSFPMHVSGVYATYVVRENAAYALYNVFWLIVILFWLRFACYTFAMLASFMYLSAYYIKMRYEQVSAKIVDVLSRDFEDSELRASLLLDAIHEHNTISNIVPRHNHIAKWVLFGLNYVCSLISAVSLLAPIYGRFDNAIFKHSITACAYELVVIMLFFAGCTGDVHLQVRLNEIEPTHAIPHLT